MKQLQKYGPDYVEINGCRTRNFICLVDDCKPNHMIRATNGRYRVGAKNPKQARQLLQKAIGFGSITIYYEDNKTVLMRSTPKTFSSKRDIPLVPEAVDVIKRQLEIIESDKETAGMAYTDYGFIFANAVGQPFDQRTYADHFNRIVAAAGIEKSFSLARTTFL